MNRSLIRTVALMAVAALALPLMAANDALSLVPTNAVTVGMVKLRDLRTSPLSGSLFEHTDKMTADGEAADFLADAGLSPSKDVDVLVVATSPRTNLGPEADVLVIAEGRFNVARLSNAITARGAVKKGAYFTMPEKEGESPAVAFLNGSLAVAGTERAVIGAIEAHAKGGTAFRGANGLGIDLGRIDPDASAWALVDVVRASRLTKGGTINTGRGQ